MQGGEDRPAGNLGHVRDGEGGIAARFAARGIDKPKVRAVEQEADGHLGLAKQALKAGLRRGLPVAILLNIHHVEVRGLGQALHEHEPRTIGVLWLKLRNHESGPQRLVVLGQGDFKRSGWFL